MKWVAALLVSLSMAITSARADGGSVPGVPRVGSSAEFSYPPAASGGGGGCSQATTYLSGASTSFTSAYTTMICGLVTDGDFANLSRLLVHATDSSTLSLKDIITATGFSITGSATFTANNGYISTTGLIDLGVAYSSIWTSSSASFGAWTTGGANQENNCPVGEASGSFDTFLIPFSFGGNTGGSVNGVGISGTTSTATGFFAADLSGTTLTTLLNGVSSGTTTGTGASPTSTNAVAWSCAGGGNIYTHNIGAVVVAKGSIGAAAWLRIYNRLHTFLNTVNATLYP